MNATFSLQKISQTANLDSNLPIRQQKFDLMAKFMANNTVNTNLGQNQIAKELRCSISTLQRYRNDKIMLSFYKIPPISHK